MSVMYPSVPSVPAAETPWPAAETLAHARKDPTPASTPPTIANHATIGVPRDAVDASIVSPSGTFRGQSITWTWPRRAYPESTRPSPDASTSRAPSEEGWARRNRAAVLGAALARR